MADSAAERQRRRRSHAAGDHRLCLPARCSLAGAPPARSIEPAIPAAVFSSAPPQILAPAPAPATSALVVGGATPSGSGESADAGEAAPGAGATQTQLAKVAAAIAADIEAMDELVGIEGSLAAMAIRLGELIDAEVDPKVIATLIREARTTLTDLTISLSPRQTPAERPAPTGGEVTDEPDGWTGMDKPV